MEQSKQHCWSHPNRWIFFSRSTNYCHHTWLCEICPLWHHRLLFVSRRVCFSYKVEGFSMAVQWPAWRHRILSRTLFYHHVAPFKFPYGGEKQFASQPLAIAPQLGETAALLADAIFSARCWQHGSQNLCCGQQEAARCWPELARGTAHWAYASGWCVQTGAFFVHHPHLLPPLLFLHHSRPALLFVSC